jgi:hypothetical protein
VCAPCGRLLVLGCGFPSLLLCTDLQGTESFKGRVWPYGVLYGCLIPIGSGCPGDDCCSKLGVHFFQPLPSIIQMFTAMHFIISREAARAEDNVCGLSRPLEVLCCLPERTRRHTWSAIGKGGLRHVSEHTAVEH